MSDHNNNRSKKTPSGIHLSSAFDFLFDQENEEFNESFKDYIDSDTIQPTNDEKLKVPYPEGQAESTPKHCVMCGSNDIRLGNLDISIKSPIDSLKSLKVVGAICTQCGEEYVNGRELRAIKCIEKLLNELFADNKQTIRGGHYMDQELFNTSHSNESKQVERATPKLLSLMKQVIALEEQLGIYNNHDNQSAQPSEASAPDPLEAQLSQLEARMDIIQRKQHSQDVTMEIMSFLVTNIKERISSARKSKIAPFHIQSEEYQKSTAEAMYDDKN